MKRKYKIGDSAKDKITGYCGIITAITDFMDGTVQYKLQPEGLRDNMPIEAYWFDEKRIEKNSEKNVGF